MPSHDRGHLFGLSFAEFQRDVTGLRSVVETWERPPLVDIAVLPGDLDCANLGPSGGYGGGSAAAGWYPMSALQWPGAVSGNCACPFDNSDSFGTRQDSTYSDCNRNQTDGTYHTLCAALCAAQSLLRRSWL